MGFVPSSSTVQLYAYFTQYARDRVINGTKEDVQALYFSLHDDDVNYFITSNSDGTINKPLTSGFVPDVTGDNDTCVKSISKSRSLVGNMLTGTSQVIVSSPTSTVVYGCTDPTATNYNSSATQDDGSCTYASPPSTSRTLLIGFPNANNGAGDSFGVSTQSNVKNFSASFSVDLLPPFGDTSNPTPTEIGNASFKIELLQPTNASSILDSSIKVNGLTLSSPISFNGATTLICTLSFQRNMNYHPNPPEIENVEIKLKLIQNAQTYAIDSTKQIYTYKAQIYSQ